MLPSLRSIGQILFSPLRCLSGATANAGATLLTHGAILAIMSKPLAVGVVFGTRPEAIKLAPVIFELQKRSRDFHLVLIATSQHRQMLDQVLDVFRIRPDLDLDLMQPNQTLNGITCRVLQAADSALQSRSLDCLVTQGDTPTACTAVLAPFYRPIPLPPLPPRLPPRP